MSLTLGGLWVAVTGTLLMQFGFTETCSNELVANLPLVVGGLTAWYGRVRQGDVNILGLRK